MNARQERQLLETWQDVPRREKTPRRDERREGKTRREETISLKRASADLLPALESTARRKLRAKSFQNARQLISSRSPNHHRIITRSSWDRHQIITHHQITTRSSPHHKRIITIASPKHCKIIVISSPNHHHIITVSSPSHHQTTIPSSDHHENSQKIDHLNSKNYETWPSKTSFGPSRPQNAPKTISLIRLILTFSALFAGGVKTDGLWGVWRLLYFSSCPFFNFSFIIYHPIYYYFLIYLVITLHRY